MEKLVAERDANGPFDVARRSRRPGRSAPAQQAPARDAGRRRARSMRSSPTAPASIAAAETILATAARVARQRDERAGRAVRRRADAVEPAIKLPLSARWTLGAADGAGEGGVRLLFLGASGRSPPPSRQDARRAQLCRAGRARHPRRRQRASGATMAALVEDARWRTSARGQALSDGDAVGSHRASSSRPVSTMRSPPISRRPRADGGCGLLTVELDRRPGEETPRVTVKRIQPFETLASSARFVLELSVATPAAMAALGALLAEARGGARRSVGAMRPLPDGGDARGAARPRLPARRRACRRGSRALQDVATSRCDARRAALEIAALALACASRVIDRPLDASGETSDAGRNAGFRASGAAAARPCRARAWRRARSSRVGPTAARRAPNWAGIARDARKLAQALERLGMQARRPHRDAGDEPQPPSGRLVWRDRDGRGDPHDQSAAVRRAARLYRQPCRGSRAVLRQGVPADRRPAEAAMDQRSSIISCSTATARTGSRR